MSTPHEPVTPREKAQQDACTGVATAFTIVSILIVGARIFTRTYIVRNIGNDDWAMLVALTITIGYLAIIYVARDDGMGFSGKKLTLDQMESLIKATLAVEIMYYILVFCVKLSILFSYLRIAVVKSFERLTKATICFLSVFCVICVIACLAQCRPLHKMWDITGVVEGTCINTTALFYSTSAINILTDIWIIALPIPTLLRIQRPNREKFGLIVVFSLGVFSCISSIVRLHSIRIYTESPDPFYDSVPVNLWSMVEVNIGIWCASIPSLKALITQRRRNSASRAKSRGYQYHSKDNNESAGKVIGGSSSDRSRGISVGLESFDLIVDDAGKVAKAKRGEVQSPQRAAVRKQSNVDSGCNVQSEDRIYSPGADGRV